MIKNISMMSMCVALMACTDNTVEQVQVPAETTVQKNIIKVGFIASPTGNAPLNFVDEHGKFQGFEYDVLQEIAKRSGYQFEYEYVPSEQIFDSLDNGKYQILSGTIKINDENKGKYAMSNSYLDDYPVTILSKDASLKTLADLKGKSVSVKDSQMESFYNYVNANKSDEYTVHFVKSDWLAVKDVIADKSVSAVGTSSFMPYFVEKYSDANTRLHFSIDYNYPKEDYGFMLNKNNEKLLEKINIALTSIKADGTYQSIYKKWF